MVQKDEKPENWVREISGNRIQFGHGAEVLDVSLPSDFSAIYLSMLPPGSSPVSVAAILAGMGFPVPVECVRIPPQGNATNCSAYIRFRDPMLAKRLCAGMRSERLTSGVKSQINAVSTGALRPYGSSSCRVDCNKVHCSWHRPFRTVWLNFGNQYIAQKVNDKFNASAYKILGQQVKGSILSSAGGYRNPLAWSVMLTDVPALGTDSDIVHEIPAANRPRHIELGDASYKMNLEEANTIVKSKFLQIGSLDWWEDAIGSAGRRAKAKARFLDEEDARKAVNLLDGTPLPFNYNGKLNVKLVHSAKIKVLESIYEAMQAEISMEGLVWKSQHLTFVSYEPVRGYRILKLEGENSNDVAQAKTTLEKILAGETVICEDKILWTPAFGINGDAYRKLKEIELSLGILVIRNRRRSRLQLFGTPEKCREAQKLLADLAKENASINYVIDLDYQQFAWACHGGFKAISAALGDGVTAFDIISVPRRILVNGSSADYRLVLSMITNQKEVDLGGEEGGTERDCVICWTEADKPIRTGCGHMYCADCFERLCFSSAAGNKESCIRCAGDSSNCMAVITLEELQEHLSSSVFEELLETSLTSYIRRHPQTFRECPTPDCGQVYRATVNASLFTCSNCLTPVCTTCHTCHQGMSCAEHRDHTSGDYEALEKAKRRLGIKDCPMCKTAIEKTEGCDHMTCVGCGTHICWKCMRTFDDPNLCYKHMNKEHGSIGLDFPELN